MPDTDSSKDSAKKIHEYFIPDFSNRQEKEDYEPFFERLLRTLKG
jgi:hypothetical protein